MAIPVAGDYKCEACGCFDADGLDGNHPYCSHGLGPKRVTDECGMFELGVPSGYEATHDQRVKRAYEIVGMLHEGAWYSK